MSSVLNHHEKKGILYFTLFLLGGLLFTAMIFVLIWGFENRKGPCVKEYWDGEDMVYVDHKRFCYFEKENEGNFTTRNNNPTMEDTCIICRKIWKSHYQNQYSQQEIREASLPDLVP